MEAKNTKHNLQYPSGSVEDEGLKKSYSSQANTVIQGKESK